MSSSVQFQSVDAFDLEDSAFRLSSQPNGAWKTAGRRWGNKLVHASWCCSCGCWSAVAICMAVGLTLVLCIASIVISQATWRQMQQIQGFLSSSQAANVTTASFRPVSRLAFGSCTSHDLRPQPIWKAITASQPDAWVWVGDMAYVDNPLVDCK